MKIRLLALAVCTLLSFSATVHAGCWGGHFLGRHLGLCWSDGYHARCDCGRGHCGPTFWGSRSCGKGKARRPKGHGEIQKASPAKHAPVVQRLK